MGATVMASECRPFRRILATSSTTNGFTRPADVLAASPPVADPSPATARLDSAAGYIDLGAGSEQATANTVKLVVYGEGADDATGSVRVYGVAPVHAMVASVPAAVGWTHVLLGEFAVTLSTARGIAGGVVDADDRYADTIEMTTGVASVTNVITSPTGNEPAHVVLDMRGFRYLLFTTSTGGSATNLNGLYAAV